ncbi:hypothetical protein EDB83DRAFT_52 [Lactarius deliciosus]|nr:hypothetical protein EDB83DRAFT_52 [Lactarius deliciosus]
MRSGLWVQCTAQRDASSSVSVSRRHTGSIRPCYSRCLGLSARGVHLHAVPFHEVLLVARDVEGSILSDGKISGRVSRAGSNFPARFSCLASTRWLIGIIVHAVSFYKVLSVIMLNARVIGSALCQLRSASDVRCSTRRRIGAVPLVPNYYTVQFVSSSGLLSFGSSLSWDYQDASVLSQSLRGILLLSLSSSDRGSV